MDANGVGIGPEFRVNTSTNSSQSDPAVAGLPNGDFVVVWTDDVADGNSYGIYAQRFNSAGASLGTEFRINTQTSSTQYQPSVSAHNGTFGCVVAVSCDLVVELPKRPIIVIPVK